MRRYDVCKATSERAELVVVLQHDSSAHLGTCIVAPLISSFVREVETRIRPILTVSGRELQLQTDRLAAIPRKSLGPVVASVEQDQDAIKNAIDRLFIGF